MPLICPLDARIRLQKKKVEEIWRFEGLSSKFCEVEGFSSRLGARHKNEKTPTSTRECFLVHSFRHSFFHSCVHSLVDPFFYAARHNKKTRHEQAEENATQKKEWKKKRHTPWARARRFVVLDVFLLWWCPGFRVQSSGFRVQGLNQFVDWLSLSFGDAIGLGIRD